MKNYLLTLIGLLFAIGLSAQTVKVTGTVLDEGRQPLLGVSIFVQSNRAHGTVTELNGRSVSYTHLTLPTNSLV